MMTLVAVSFEGTFERIDDESGPVAYITHCNETK